MRDTHQANQEIESRIERDVDEGNAESEETTTIVRQVSSRNSQIHFSSNFQTSRDGCLAEAFQKMKRHNLIVE